MDSPSTHVSELNAFRSHSGNEAAKERLLVRYRSVIFHWCLRRLHNEHDAEDMTQEVLVKLLKSLPAEAYDPSRARFRSWLKSVVNNAITDHGRRKDRKRECAAVGGTACREHIENFPDQRSMNDTSTGSPDSHAANAGVVVKQVQSVTSPKSWEIFQQSAIERRPAAHIAADFGISVGAVYKTTFRVKKRLVEAYEDVNHASPILPCRDVGDLVA